MKRLLFLPLLLLLVGQAWGANCGGITSCNCGDTVTESYSITSNLVCTNAGDALTINGNGITLDLAGHTISGDSVNTVRGVYNASSNNFTITSSIGMGIITGFTSSGVEIAGGTSPTLSNLDISSTGNGGAHAQLRIANTSAPTLSNLNIHDSNSTVSTRGLSFTSTTGTHTLSNVTLTKNAGYGWTLYGSSGTINATDITVTSNTEVNGSGIYGSAVTATLQWTGINASDNNEANSHGLYLTSCTLGTGSTISGIFSGNKGNGVYIQSTNNLTLTSFIARDNTTGAAGTGSGVIVSAGTNNIVQYGTIANNSADGIDFSGNGSGIGRWNVIYSNGNAGDVAASGDGISQIDTYVGTYYGNIIYSNQNTCFAVTGGTGTIANNTCINNGSSILSTTRAGIYLIGDVYGSEGCLCNPRPNMVIIIVVSSKCRISSVWDR